MGKARNLANLQPSADGQIETNDIQDLAVTPAKMSQKLTSGTAVASTSGTAIDFTGIPSWARRITVMFSGLSLSGGASPLIQLGDAGGIEATGYLSSSVFLFGAVSSGNATSTSGIVLIGNDPNNQLIGSVVFSNLSGNLWVASGGWAYGNALGVNGWAAGNKTLSAPLNRIRITTTNGTDTFDAGTINIMWE